MVWMPFFCLAAGFFIGIQNLQNKEWIENIVC